MDSKYNNITGSPCAYSEFLEEKDANGCLRRFRDIRFFLKRELFEQLPLQVQSKLSQQMANIANNCDVDQIPVDRRDTEMLSRYDQSRTEIESYMEDVKGDMDSIKDIVSKEHKSALLRKELEKFNQQPSKDD